MWLFVIKIYESAKLSYPETLNEIIIGDIMPTDD